MTKGGSHLCAPMVPSRRDGSIQAVDVRGLVRWASRHHHLLAMQAAVGDFVATGDHVIAVFGDGTVPAKTSRQLQRMGCEFGFGGVRVVSAAPAPATVPPVTQKREF